MVVRDTNKILVLKLRLDDEKTLGINKKITKGFFTPPVKYIKALNWKISITKKRNANLSDN